MALKRNIQPALGPVSELSASNPEAITLSNNIPVYILEAGDEDIIRIDFIFQAGSRYQNRIFQASATNSLLSEGTKTKTARQIADEIDFYGSFLFPGCSRDESHIQIYSLTKYLPQTLDIVADIILNPSFPENELNIFRKKKIQSMAIENQKAETRARKAFTRTLFGAGHPYGQMGEPEDMSGVERTDLVDFYSSYYQPANCSILISGKNAGDYTPLLEDRFGSPAPSPIVAGELFPTGPELKPERYQINEAVPGAVQASIRIGKIMPDKNHSDYNGLSIVNTILGGFFGSRLMQNIREEKGYTYGVGSSLHSHKEKGIFMISTDVGLDYYKQTIEECYKEIELICTALVTDQELKRVRQYIEGELLQQLDGPFNLAESFRSLLSFGMDFSFLQDFLSVLNNITPGDIRSLSSKYFNGEQFIQVVAGVNEK